MCAACPRGEIERQGGAALGEEMHKEWCVARFRVERFVCGRSVMGKGG